MAKLDLNFSFSIKDWNPDGMARVEYTHATLGTILKQIFLPLNFSEAEQRHQIIAQCPHNGFHSRWLIALQREGQELAPAVTEGSFVIDLVKPEDNLVEQVLDVAKV